MTSHSPYSATGFLAQLNSKELDDLNAWGHRRHFSKGQTLFNEGDPSDRVVVILSGRVKIAHFTEDGREVILAVREPGDIIGELSAIDGEPRSASGVALEAGHSLVLPAEDFRKYLEGHPRIALLILEMLSSRLRDSSRKQIEFGAFDSTGRVARRLIELAERFGEDTGSGIRINLSLSQQELAGWIGSSREAVSKALQTLRSRGLIETHRRNVTIFDLEGLRKRAT